MGMFITGRDPNAASWPVKSLVSSAIQRPSNYTVTGTGGDVNVLKDSSDSTTVNEYTANRYFQYNCAAISLPTGARISSANAVIRARLQLSPANTRYKDTVIWLWDHSSPRGTATSIPKAGIHVSLSNTMRTFSTPGVNKNSQGQLLTQNDINKKMIVVFGLNEVYSTNTNSSGAVIAEAYINYQYDLPPTCNITSPASGAVYNETNAPYITWDYFDDFHSQVKYQLSIWDSTGAIKYYDSGLISSSITAHQVTTNLPNGNYQVRVRVYQWWNGPGGDFRANDLAIQPFSIDVLQLGVPRLAAASVAEHSELTIYPDVNLLNYDSATFDNGSFNWFGSNATITTTASPVKDGLLSGAVTISATGGPYVQTPPGEVAVTPGSVLKGFVYANPLALSNRTAQYAASWYDSAFTFISTSAGNATTLATNQWTQVSANTLTAPTNAAWARVRIVFGGISVNDKIYLDDVGLWWQADTTTLPTWTRGGFYESSPNLLNYVDSSIEDDTYTWEPGANSTIVRSSTQKLHGLSSLNVTRSITGTGDCSAVLGTVNSAISVAATGSYALHGWANSGSTRTCDFGISWYKSDLTPSATASTTNSASCSAGVWTKLEKFVTAPPDASYAVPYLKVTGATSTSEAHYFDALSFYSTIGYNTLGFFRGAFPNTDIAPTLFVEYTDDNLVFKEVDSVLLSPLMDKVIITDYTLKSGVTRSYRASLREIENGNQLNSDYATFATAAVTLLNVWMHSELDPAGTSYNFVWDGGGRARTLGASPALVPVEGSPYPFAQFGIQSDGNIDVTLHLDNSSDIDAMETLANTKAIAIFRDQRGRSYRGVLGEVRFTDLDYGQSASFTFQLTGIQP